uniref:Uncharacterized protein n=1 Tax=Rhizobium phage IG49 TaxID=3129228 RepID=A0AAU8HYK2_9CAUD
MGELWVIYLSVSIYHSSFFFNSPMLIPLRPRQIPGSCLISNDVMSDLNLGVQFRLGKI